MNEIAIQIIRNVDFKLFAIDLTYNQETHRSLMIRESEPRTQGNHREFL